jgi:radical SAM-linked protein
VRERLQVQLPQGFLLSEVSEVPVAAPSLSQELVAASWRLELVPDVVVGAERWQQAAAALLARDSWIWEDTDKKGRPRSRECRPDLIGLAVAVDQVGTAVLDYSTAIDPAGRSLRPEHLQRWFQDQLGQVLQLQSLRRQSLRLRHS